MKVQFHLDVDDHEPGKAVSSALGMKSQGSVRIVLLTLSRSDFTIRILPGGSRPN